MMSDLSRITRLLAWLLVRRPDVFEVHIAVLKECEPDSSAPPAEPACPDFVPHPDLVDEQPPTSEEIKFQLDQLRSSRNMRKRALRIQQLYRCWAVDAAEQDQH